MLASELKFDFELLCLTFDLNCHFLFSLLTSRAGSSPLIQPVAQVITLRPHI